MALRLIYCAQAVKSDARRLPHGRRNQREKERMGQRYAEEIRPGVWMCLCCGKRVTIVT